MLKKRKERISNNFPIMSLPCVKEKYHSLYSAQGVMKPLTQTSVKITSSETKR